jgi:uracil-DNA glycosylase family 4
VIGRASNHGEVLPRDQEFVQLANQVQACTICPRMTGRTRVLGPANGSVTSRLLFVAEAPGRLGADACGTPLSGDRTGDTFDLLLEAGGIRRREIFISNAVLCNPRDDRGKNAKPSRQEIENCRSYLAQLINLIDPTWVVTLGVVALETVAAISPHSLILRRDVAQAHPWFNRWLVPLYHPGPRALLHRPLAIQQQDYAWLGEITALSRSLDRQHLQ